MKTDKSYIQGIGVSLGTAIGKAFVLKKNNAALIGKSLETKEEITIEIEKFDVAVKSSVAEIETIKNYILPTSTPEAAEILETQIELLQDPEIRECVLQKINEEKKSANDALLETIHSFVELFKNMNDEYMSARSADVQDIGNRILKNLNHSTEKESIKFEPGSIIIADDIPPSDILSIDLSQIAGIATCNGSKTSHASIIAKSKNIPAVAGCGNDLLQINNADTIILDGIKGYVIINPDENIITEYTKLKDNYIKKRMMLQSLKDVAPITTDGRQIKLTANISNSDDLDVMFENGGEGVGLFRTELLFMNRDSFPTEEEQFDFYKKVALKSKNKPVIIRTIDIGGDKQVSYFGLPMEQNPFLGYRAIRICLDRKDIFIAQLKAILRASIFGNLKIMFPMIANAQELRAAKEILTEAKNELIKSNIKFDEKIQVGIMIEIPAAAIAADILAKEADFFSIGTNDLIQYTLAVDRMNDKIKDLYDPFNPAVLRLIQNSIEQAHKHNIHVGMCGEMASDPLATLLLLGMGLDEFSMSAASIPDVKNCIITNSFANASAITKKVMEIDDSKKIITYLKEIIS